MDTEFLYICSSPDCDSISMLICLKIIIIFETNYFFINFAVKKKTEHVQCRRANYVGQKILNYYYPSSHMEKMQLIQCDIPYCSVSEQNLRFTMVLLF